VLFDEDHLPLESPIHYLVDKIKCIVYNHTKGVTIG
jgi:hypothetical protein